MKCSKCRCPVSADQVNNRTETRDYSLGVRRVPFAERRLNLCKACAEAHDWWSRFYLAAAITLIGIGGLVLVYLMLA